MFNYYPSIAAFFYSFTNWNGFNPPEFIGLRNFQEMFTTELFKQAFWNLLWFTLFSVFVSVSIPLVVARLLYKVKNARVQHLYRLLFVFPLVIPVVVILLLWQFILNPDVGPVNAMLLSFGVPDERLPLWLGGTDTALISIMLVGFPWVNGVALLIYLAGFQNIPPSITEAATMDGAKGALLFWRIELPLVISQIKLVLILNIISSLQGFQTQQILTDGGPGYATTVPGLVMYNEAMMNSRFGFACAIGVVLFILIFAITFINNRYLKSSIEYGADS